MILAQLIYINPIPPPPPPIPESCERIKTNQLCEQGICAEPLQDFPGSGTWTGAVSGATGLHQRYFYEPEPAGVPNTEQQYIVMSNVQNGPFVTSEDLTGA